MAILIIIFTLTLRLISLNQSLWLDEAVNVMAVHETGLLDLITKYTIADFHPPGYFVLLWFWTKIFGYSEIAVRLPSVFFAVATVYLTYLIGKKLFSQKVATWAALFLAVAPLHIYYSQEARMYSFAAFAVTLSIYALLKLEEKGWKPIILYALSLSLVLYSDYVAYFILPVHLFYLLMNKKLLKNFLTSSGITFLTFVPWLLIFPTQLRNGEQTAGVLSGWKAVVGGANFKTAGLLVVKTVIGRISFDNKFVYGAMVTLAGLPYLILSRQFTKITVNSKLLLILNWLLVPPILTFLVSFYIPVFSYFRLIFILPALYLLAAVAVNRLPKRSFVLGIWIVAISLILSGFYLFNPSFQREDWRGATTYLQKNHTEESVVLFEDLSAQAPFRYYNHNQLLAFGGLKTLPATRTSDLVDLQSRLTNVSTVYLFEYLVEVNDPGRLLEKDLQSLGWKKEITYNFKGVGFIYRYTHPLPDTAHPH